MIDSNIDIPHQKGDLLDLMTLLGSLDRIWQFCNIKICSFASSLGTSGEGKKSGFGKLFNSQNTEAEQTFQLSLAGHHSHPMYLFFFSDKRATFGIAQAAELIIETPWDVLSHGSTLLVWFGINTTTRLSKAKTVACSKLRNQICYLSNVPSLFKASMPKAGTCQYSSASLDLTQHWPQKNFT